LDERFRFELAIRKVAEAPEVDFVSDGLNLSPHQELHCLAKIKFTHDLSELVRELSVPSRVGFIGGDVSASDG
jgi:hypothetical protein